MSARAKSFGDVTYPVLEKVFFCPILPLHALDVLCWHWESSPTPEPHLHSLHDMIGHYQCRCRLTNCQVCSAIAWVSHLSARVSENTWFQTIFTNCRLFCLSSSTLVLQLSALHSMQATPVAQYWSNHAKCLSISLTKTLANCRGPWAQCSTNTRLVESQWPQ